MPTDLLPPPRILMGPGPSMADPRVLRALATPLLGQFDPQFTAIMDEVMALARTLFQSAGARTFPVRVRVKNELREDGPVLKAGMIARAVLSTGAVRKSLLVPKDALVLGGPRPLVFVVERNPQNPDEATVRSVPVTAGVASGSLIAVSGDLDAGQQVVTLGNERLRPGDRVRTSEATANATPP